MGSLDQEVINSERGWERRGQMRLGWSSQRNVNMDLDISKVRENDMPF
jgi:hypothetical protein